MWFIFCVGDILNFFFTHVLLVFVGSKGVRRFLLPLSDCSSRWRDVGARGLISICLAPPCLCFVGAVLPFSPLGTGMGGESRNVSRFMSSYDRDPSAELSRVPSDSRSCYSQVVLPVCLCICFLQRKYLASRCLLIKQQVVQNEMSHLAKGDDLFSPRAREDTG